MFVYLCYCVLYLDFYIPEERREGYKKRQTDLFQTSAFQWAQNSLLSGAKIMFFFNIKVQLYYIYY